MSNETQLNELMDRWEELRERGELTPVKDLCAECPELADELMDRIAALRQMDSVLVLAASGDATLSDERPDGDGDDSMSPPLGIDPKLGRYRVIRLLGQGGFGRVFLGHDDDLDRPVAIKVPHRERIAHPEDVEAYLAEARILARLDHPNIVPVHDVGRTGDGLCYVVSKLITGGSLAARNSRDRPAFSETAGCLSPKWPRRCTMPIPEA